MFSVLVWKSHIFIPTCALVPIPSTSNTSVKINIALPPAFVWEFGAGNVGDLNRYMAQGSGHMLENLA